MEPVFKQNVFWHIWNLIRESNHHGIIKSFVIRLFPWLPAANLEKALEKLGFSNDRYIIVWTEKGKVTPIFNFSNIQDGNVMRYACHGFMTIG